MCVSSCLGTEHKCYLNNSPAINFFGSFCDFSGSIIVSFSNNPIKCPSVPLGVLEANRCDFFADAVVYVGICCHYLCSLDAFNNSSTVQH